MMGKVLSLFLCYSPCTYIPPYFFCMCLAGLEGRKGKSSKRSCPVSSQKRDAKVGRRLLSSSSFSSSLTALTIKGKKPHNKETPLADSGYLSAVIGLGTLVLFWFFSRRSRGRMIRREEGSSRPDGRCLSSRHDTCLRVEDCRSRSRKLDREARRRRRREAAAWTSSSVMSAVTRVSSVYIHMRQERCRHIRVYT